MTQKLLKCLNIEKWRVYQTMNYNYSMKALLVIFGIEQHRAIPNKVGTSDMGTTLHAFLLEPNTYEDQVDVASVKGRNTVAFQKHQYKAATY